MKCRIYLDAERIPGGTRQNDGLEIETVGGCGRENGVVNRP